MEFADKLRRLLQWLWVSLLLASGGLWWAKRQLRRKGAVVVLMFHRVLGPTDYRHTNSLAGMIVRQRTFAKLAEHIARRCEAVGLVEAEPGTSGRKVKVALTFDDGWRDNYTTALPIARAQGLPLTVFVCTGLAGCNSPFWPERAAASLRAVRPAGREAEIEAAIEQLKRLTPEERERRMENLSSEAGAVRFGGDSVLAWEEVGEMDRAGVTLGAHTHTHQILTTVPLSTARREIRESRDALEGALGTRCDLFAYPNGEWSLETRQMLAEEGFRLAFTTERGAWTADCDRLRIPRANICEQNLAGLTGSFSPVMFEYTTFWRAWRATVASSRSRIRSGRRRPAPATLGAEGIRGAH